MTTYEKLLRRTAEIPGVDRRVRQLVHDETVSVLHLLDAVRRYERKELPEPVHHHGNGSAPCYDTAIKLGLLEKREPPADNRNRWPLLVSTPHGQATYSQLKREGHDFAPPEPVSTRELLPIFY